MQALTRAPAGDLPPLAEQAAGEPFWHYPAGTTGRDGVAHLRVRATEPDPAGHLAAVTETGRGALVTESAGQIRAGLARRYGPSLMLLENLGRGTGRLIIPALRVLSVRFPVSSVLPVRSVHGNVHGKEEVRPYERPPMSKEYLQGKAGPDTSSSIPRIGTRHTTSSCCSARDHRDRPQPGGRRPDSGSGAEREEGLRRGRGELSATEPEEISKFASAG
jgi:hypothetical protein